jgi:hypothetical protein
MSLLLGATFISVVLAYLPFVRIDPDPHHDGLVLKNALDVAHGLTLYRQSFNQYGPLFVFTDAAGVATFGYHLIVLHWLSVVFLAAAAVLLVWAWSRALYSCFDRSAPTAESRPRRLGEPRSRQLSCYASIPAGHCRGGRSRALRPTSCAEADEPIRGAGLVRRSCGASSDLRDMAPRHTGREPVLDSERVTATTLGPGDRSGESDDDSRPQGFSDTPQKACSSPD